ncbi:MAG: FAD-dependent oxidoreductase, partial [Myxococcaceae bacterium]
GGAWGGSLGASCGAPLSLTPLRRHLAILEASFKLDPGAPIIWDAEHEVYVRPESGGVLSSPGDEEPWPAELPPASQAGLELLAVKLARFAPRFADAAVRRSWACLRTFTSDRAAAVGPDPRVDGLYWLAGLGGHGMTGGLAAGELLACSFSGRPHPLTDVLAPARLLAMEPAAARAV